MRPLTYSSGNAASLRAAYRREWRFLNGFYAEKDAHPRAMTVQDIRFQRSDQAHEMYPCQNIRGRWMARDGETMNPEFEAGSDVFERRVGAFPTGQTVRENADVMAALGLAIGKVHDVAECSTYRRAQCVQDTQRLICTRSHVQNQRSPTRTVSFAANRQIMRACAPGIGVPMGTVESDSGLSC